MQTNEYKKYFSLGKRFSTQSNFQNALAYFEKCLDIIPNDIDSLLKKASCLKNLKKFEEANQIYDTCINLNPSNSYVYYKKRGNCFESLNLFNDAEKSYSKSIELKPDYLKGYEKKANCLYILNQNEKSLEMYEKCLNLKPNQDVIYKNKAYVLLKLKKYSEALESFDNYLKNSTALIYPLSNKYKIEIEFYNLIFQAYPIQNILLRKAYCLEKLNESREAELCYDDAIKINPQTLDSYIQKAKFYIGQKKFDEAISVSDKYLLINPKFTDFIYFKGKCLIELKNYEEAIQCFDLVKDINKIYEGINFQKGLCLFYMEKYSYAIASFDLESSENRFYASCLIKGICLKKLQKYEEAFIELNKAISLKSQNVNFFDLGLDSVIEYDSIPNYKTLKFSNTKRIADYMFELNFLLGECLIELKRYEEAIECFEKESSNNKKFECCLKIGICLFFLKRYEESLIKLREAENLNPKNTEVHFYLVKVKLVILNSCKLNFKILEFHT